MLSCRLAVVAVAVCATISPALAKQRISSSADLIATLESGHEVAVSVDLSRCAPEAGTTASRSRGGVRIGAYRLTDDGTLSFSDTQFIAASSDGRPFQQFQRYQVAPDNRVRLTTSMYELPSLQQRGPLLAYQCTLDQGIRFHAD
ncbi:MULTISPECIES: VirK family protein [Xanthomonas]|uniref:VirK family protein n=1 Tax=Xanthomonas dyei TaxID=743699 RepID=A0ABZ0DEK5_9XANT|nr:VirK family protein [Xanthomonas dyei]MCC4632127.1 VirK family protein [Xanthomonas dyei pv. eucalypti]WOB26901.1 VirK family protein [Xanthomonas dyei]WOB54521.1 VirK family protein [Xanthomonas dyei]